MQNASITSTEAQAKRIALLIPEFSQNWEFKSIIIVNSTDKLGIYFKFILKFESQDIQLYVAVIRDGTYENSYTL